LERRIHSITALAVTLGVVTVVAAGCGGGDGGYGGGGDTSSTAASAGAAAVDVADNAQLGEILVDSQGRTLYLFEKDGTDQSNCSGTCAQVWPPLTTDGSPKAGEGVTASKLGTLKRDDGSTQVAFDGHPLYLYAEDTAPGDTNGNELDQFGAEWYALHPDGENAEGESSGDEGGSSSGGGSGGYSY
jgi:predicted lipoprotein with Yx(FWY)xxD motif